MCNPADPCIVNNNSTSATFTATGQVTITAFQFGDDNWNEAYSDPQSFQVLPAPPVLSSPFASNVLATTAELGATIDNSYGAQVTEYGAAWSTTSGFTDGTWTSVTGSFGTGTFSVVASNLAAGTLHYFRAYAVSSGGTNVTAESSFFTRPDAPAIAGRGEYRRHAI